MTVCYRLDRAEPIEQVILANHSICCTVFWCILYSEFQRAWGSSVSLSLSLSLSPALSKSLNCVSDKGPSLHFTTPTPGSQHLKEELWLQDRWVCNAVAVQVPVQLSQLPTINSKKILYKHYMKAWMMDEATKTNSDKHKFKARHNCHLQITFFFSLALTEAHQDCSVHSGSILICLSRWAISARTKRHFKRWRATPLGDAGCQCDWYLILIIDTMTIGLTLTLIWCDDNLTLWCCCMLHNACLGVWLTQCFLLSVG